ncbi:MAG: hypothetical protein ACM3JB_19845, partial [Acidobacteriaceae bacterium]
SPRKRAFPMQYQFASLLLLAFLCPYAAAGDSRTVKLECEKAIVKAEVLAAHRKWWPERPDPNAPVLSIRTHANFAKNAVPFGIGAIISHEKVGELTFEDQNGECLIESNGHPADVVLDDLSKQLATSRAAKRQDASPCNGDNPLYSVDCHGNLKTAATSR